MQGAMRVGAKLACNKEPLPIWDAMIRLPLCLRPYSPLLSTGVAILQEHRMARNFWSRADLGLILVSVVDV